MNRQSFNLHSALNWFIFGAITIYISLFAYNSLTRTRQFSPDSMNYVDVARNIASGKGIVQSTLGFNQTFLFQADSQIPTPLVSQPPLYPLLIALLSHAGLTPADAALAIPAIAYGIILFLAYLLTRDLYSERVALLSVAALLLYAPLRFVSNFAWTESPGIVFLLLSLWLLVRSSQTSLIRNASTSAFFAGLAAGLAFSTRYALFPLAFLGILFLAIEHRGKQRRLQVMLLFMLGVGLPIALVLGHNLLSTGQLIPPTLPSDRALLTNLHDATFSLIGNYFSKGSEKTQAAIAASVFIISVITLAVQRRTRELLNVFVLEKHYLLTSWVIFYSAFIVYQRTTSYFDSINARIMVLAGVILLVLGVALLMRAFQPITPNRYVFYGILAVITIVVFAGEMRSILSQPNMIADQQTQIIRSDRLTWIAQHTTDDDLIIGEDTVDIPFYLGRQAAVSFSPYPYTIHLTYKNLMDYANHNCQRYQHIYLVLRRHSEWQYRQQVYHFGAFIADIKEGRIADYPGVYPLYQSNDIIAFEVTCK